MYIAASSVNCSFESNLKCGYLQEDTASGFEWTLNRLSTPSEGTGPTVDNTRKSPWGLLI